MSKTTMIMVTEFICNVNSLVLEPQSIFLKKIKVCFKVYFPNG